MIAVNANYIFCFIFIKFIHSVKSTGSLQRHLKDIFIHVAAVCYMYYKRVFRVRIQILITKAQIAFLFRH